MGGDSTMQPENCGYCSFQSTPPHGGRPVGVVPLLNILGFNPRPRMGGDLGCRRHRSYDNRFNPRPRMGGDRPSRHLRGNPQVSIHAPAWGATSTAGCLRTDISVSIHAPAWGATVEAEGLAGVGGFQSTPPHGGRREVFTLVGVQLSFNPRPRMGGDWATG